MKGIATEPEVLSKTIDPVVLKTGTNRRPFTSLYNFNGFLLVGLAFSNTFHIIFWYLRCLSHLESAKSGLTGYSDEGPLISFDGVKGLGLGFNCAEREATTRRRTIVMSDLYI